MEVDDLLWRALKGGAKIIIIIIKRRRSYCWSSWEPKKEEQRTVDVSNTLTFTEVVWHFLLVPWIDFIESPETPHQHFIGPPFPACIVKPCRSSWWWCCQRDRAGLITRGNQGDIFQPAQSGETRNHLRSNGWAEFSPQIPQQPCSLHRPDDDA